MQLQKCKANHNRIGVNAFQFAALLERNFTEVVVAGVESPAVPMAARLLASLMRDLNPDWTLMREGDYSPLPPATFHFNPKNVVPVSGEYVDASIDDYSTVRAVPLRELEAPRSGSVGAVMLICIPNSYTATTKYLFELFVQIDGFIYSTGVAQEREDKDGIRLFSSAVSGHDIGRRLAQPLPVTEPRSSLDIWIDANYGLLSGYQHFINEYLGEGATPLEAIEDFRTGIERATLLEINKFPPKALAVLDTTRPTPRRIDRTGADGTIALNSLKSVGELSFYPVPKQYEDKPLHWVRVVEDPEVAGEFVVYLAFIMPSGCFEEQAVITGRNFKAIYSAANQLADANLIQIQYSADVSKYFEQ